MVVLVAVAWLSAGTAPFTDAAEGARAPIDFVRDYVGAHARVHGGRGAAPADEAGNAYAAMLGAPRVVLLNGPYYLRPPPALLPILPLAMLGFEGAARVWLALSLIALSVLAYFVFTTASRREGLSAGWVAATFALMILWPPVLHNLAKGQWSILLATLIAAGQHALARDRPRTAGIWLGAAASLKATPGLLLIFLILRHRRAAVAMLGTMVGAALVSLAALGREPWMAFIADAPRDVAAWQTWIANTAALNGFFSRLFVTSAFTEPLTDAPMVSRALGAAVAVTLVALAIHASLRAPRGLEEDRRLFAAWTILGILLNPLGWSHTLVIALLPLALLAESMPRTLTAAILVLLSVPRETLATLAGPPPVSAGRALVLSLHAAALLILLGMALAAAPARLSAPHGATA